MDKAKTFKLIVTQSSNSLKVCKYLDKNITTINSLGAFVRVEKIGKDEFEESLVEELRNSGITRLPALIAPDGKTFVGVEAIVTLFEKNLRKRRNVELVTPENTDDVGKYWMSQLYSGRDTTGKLVVRNDDDSDDERADMDRKLSKQRSAPQPRHRVQEPDSPSPPPRRRREDNIAEPMSKPKPHVFEPSGDSGGDDMDRRMMAAWMDKLPSDM